MENLQNFKMLEMKIEVASREEVRDHHWERVRI